MPEEQSRRNFFSEAAAGLFAAVVLFGRADAQSASNVVKQTKVEALYQDKPKNGQLCGICAYFVAPMNCLRVEGDIRPTGWCKNFQKRT